MIFMLWPLQIINSSEMIFNDKLMHYCCELNETTETQCSSMKLCKKSQALSIISSNWPGTLTLFCTYLSKDQPQAHFYWNQHTLVLV